MAFHRKYNFFFKGFTLLELLVSIGIIGLITAVVVFNQKDFSDQVSLSNVANEIDLQIREAQVYGTSVREYSGSFSNAYGVSFNIGNNGSSNSSFISFVDNQSVNGFYDSPGSCSPGSTSECLGRINLLRGNTITKICADKTGNPPSCSPANIGRVDITFLRPSPEAKIFFFNPGGNPFIPNYDSVSIELTSPKGKKMNVKVYTSGQIAVQ